MSHIQIYILSSNLSLYERIKSFSFKEGSIEQVISCKEVTEAKQHLERSTGQAVLIIESDIITPVKLIESFPVHKYSNVIFVHALLTAREVKSSPLKPFDLIIPTSLSLLELEMVCKSVDSLLVERTRQRVSSALQILADEVAGQLDQIAYMKRKGYPAEVSQAVLKDMCQELQTLSDEEQVQFHSYFLESCKQQPPFTGEFEVRLPYVGVSNRVRKKLSTRAQNILQEAQDFRRKVGT